MVEYSFSLDYTFNALSDATRRDILHRLSGVELTVGEIAQPYPVSFAAISKHLKVLERARLVIKRKSGKQQMVSLAPQAFADAAEYLEWYRSLWENRLDSLDNYLNESKE